MAAISVSLIGGGVDDVIEMAVLIGRVLLWESLLYNEPCEVKCVVVFNNAPVA
jgi:hypothetical protein